MVTVAERRLKRGRDEISGVAPRREAMGDEFPWDKSHGYSQISLRERLHKN
jgi:hypothetical protein